MEYPTHSQQDSVVPSCAKLCVTSGPDEVKHIGFLLFSGFSLPEAATVLEMFQEANLLARSERPLGRRVHYDVTLLSIAGGRVDSSSSVFVWAERAEDRRFANGLHALFIAGGAGARHALRDERQIRWLRREGFRSNVVVPIGDGRLLLDAAGIERPIHGWDASLREAWEQYQRNENCLAAVATVPVRKAIALIEQDFGGKFAREVVGRVMTQHQPAALIARVHEDVSGFVSERIRAAARWMEANGERAISIEEIANAASMSERNFLRRFRAEMGITPSDYLLRVRIKMSCHLLLETDLSVDKIARHCGLGSGGWLSKVFRKHFSTTPTEYRAQMRHTDA
ncbi:AraC family transcriptional regulator [Paraburkholderia tropica]|uniref:GlxA family transcriptional regulator n=1 Tax=Paraburkholderia tropica TaxID=92647 RepID=UPI001CAEA9EE|nr:helix-turn-helix domain-containing protein [Paraburkholderia tropica]CAG9238451.1 AraC family transcriptional regulator [Paraburkholderia tropica]